MLKGKSICLAIIGVLAGVGLTGCGLEPGDDDYEPSSYRRDPYVHQYKHKTVKHPQVKTPVSTSPVKRVESPRKDYSGIKRK